MMRKLRPYYFLLFSLVIAAAGFHLRMRAVEMLPPDYDEDDYFRAAQLYSNYIRSGDLNGIMNEEFNQEHPPLAKLVFGAVLATMPETQILTEQNVNAAPSQSMPQPHTQNLRITSAVLGSLEVLFLSLVNPLAGIALVIHTFTIKYTSQIMLEALPALLTLLAVITYSRAKGRGNNWFFLSAALLGFAAASKYIYASAGLAILIHFLFLSEKEPTSPRFPRRLGLVFLWGVAALATFFAADPYLWPDPINRLQASLLYSVEYSQSTHVASAGFPWWQPFLWLSQSVPWHPGVFLFSLDIIITLLAAIGVIPLARKRSIYLVWFAVGLIFLLLWPTKWPQYILILTAPFCLLAAEGFKTAFFNPIKEWIRNPEGKPKFH